jgi:DNA-directed RNA polymerase
MQLVDVIAEDLTWGNIMSSNLVDIQRQLEEEMRETSIERYRKEIRKAKDKKQESNTLYGVQLMKHSVETLAQGIREFVKDAFSGKVGKMNTAAPMLNSIDPEVAAYLTLKMVVDGVSKRLALTNVCMSIASALEDEFKFGIFEDQEKHWFKVIRNEVTKRTSNRHFRRYALIHTMNKKALIDYEPWDKKEKLLLGTKMIDILIRTTGIVEVKTHVYGKRQRKTYIVATDKTLDWIEKVNKSGELLSPAYLPCVIEPKDWTSPTGGGYHFNTLRPLPMIKTYNRKYLEEMEAYEMPVEYKAINALQKTRWAVNKKVLDVMTTCWESGGQYNGIPNRDPLPIPPSPFPDRDKDTFSESEMIQFKQYKAAASRIHQTNARNTSKRLQFIRTIQLAERFSEYDAFYYPYQSDFRGRKYVTVSFLSPQGTEYAKALLHFADGKPLASDDAVKWLAVHGANCFGFDKASLEDRELWAHMHTAQIRASASNPLENLFWQEADDPWMFLAFCYEWDGYCVSGLDHISHLPIGLDGSNNGLQHFSAQLRDRVAGFATNLIPSDKPQDIYQEVADKVNQKLKIDAAKGCKMSQQWLDFGVTRKCTKRPVMVLPYGGQRFSCRAYIEEYVRDRMESGDKSPWGDDLFPPTNFLTGLVWDAIGETVVSARAAMDWIQAVAADISALNLPLIWTSPSGFVVQQQYPSLVERRITTYIDNTLIKPTANELDFQNIDKRRSVQGSSPNFVHSMDAAAMSLTIIKCVEDGITDFAMIHDSYGVHAADTAILASNIRNAFYEMYTQHDVLEEFREEALRVLDEVPPVPPKGDLDLEEVLLSDFFFA